jgi:hypothetical protein
VKRFKFDIKIGASVPGHVGALRPPFDVVETFGTKGRVPVCGTINGYPFRSSLSNMGEGHCMPLNKALREAARVKEGDVVRVVMQRDGEERTVEPPPQLKKALAKSKTAQANWEKMSFTNKKEIARSITEAKQEETRTRRLAKAMDILRSGKKWTG